MWAFYKDLVLHAPGIFLRALVRTDSVFDLISKLILAFLLGMSNPVAKAALSLWQAWTGAKIELNGVPIWWSGILLGIVFLHGLFGYVNERNQKSERERDSAKRDRDALREELVGRENRELEAQRKWCTEDALEAYLDQMQKWVLDDSRPLAAAHSQDPRRGMARTRTLTILQRLDPDRKRDVVRFLHEHRLINKDQPVVRLRSADLNNANLSGMELSNSNLSGSNLSGANLTKTKLCGYHGSSASWEEALERGGGWEDALEPWAESDLSDANLTGATLVRTWLGGCDLLSADFADAKLVGADVRGADLRLARNLTQEQLETTYGSSGQQQFMPDTLLPDYLKAPELWNKLVSQQAKAREQAG
jgi:hypothetical protein